MKKLMFAMLVAMVSLVNVNAQEKGEGKGGFTQGDVYVSGMLDYTSYEESNSLLFVPTAGYFVNDNIAVEASLIIGSVEDVSSTFGAAVGGTYYFTPAKQFSFTTGASLAYVSVKDDSTDVKYNTFSIGVTPGVSYFISDAFALRAGIGALSYSSSKADFDGAEATSTFNLNVDLSDVNFGLTYKF